jgi:glycosyltransferase involved in cell wall biosynthesis
VASLSNISVIVPTFNRGASLQRLLASLDSLELPDSVDAEAIIVDNGPTDNTREILIQEKRKQNRFRFAVLKEETRGKSSAVNCGIRSAQGEILILVDDDVVLHPKWLVKHIECYRTTDFDAVQGRILPGVDPEGRPADPSRLREYNIPIVDHGDEVKEIRGLLATNISFKREVFEKIGFYDPRLGVGASGFGEDTEYSIRIRKAGFKIGYAPHAVVYHELDPRRYGREYNRMVEYRKGLSRNIYRQDPILFRVIPDLMANCLRYGLYRLLGKTQKAYKTEGRILKYWGYLSGKLGWSKFI